MIPRIDADVLRYEIGSCGQFIGDDGELVIRDEEKVFELLDQAIQGICEAVMSSGDPVLYLTSSQELVDKVNRRNRFMGEELMEYKPNFREAVAVTKPYKGTRKKDKPFHFMNLTLYMIENYDVRIANGMEADDLMSIDQMKDLENSVICSRDKDLRITKGWHYGWACGKQPEFEMQEVDDLGYITLNDAKKKVEGVGMKFFYAQMIMGDTTDNIPGIPGKGYKAAYNALYEATSVDECKAIVVGMYKDKYGEEALERFTEQAKLLWMVRELDEQGYPVERGWNV